LLIKNVIIYLRLSRDEQNLGIDEALKAHESMLINLCKERGYKYKVYKEIGSSSSIEGRPVFQQVLEEIKKGIYDAIVVKDLDRLARNRWDMSDIERVLYNTNTYIVTPNDIIDLHNDSQFLLSGITGIVAQQEYKQLHKRMFEKKQYLMAEGKSVNGIPPLGYSRDENNKLIPNERADDVKYIFTEIAKGTSIPELIDALDRMNIRTIKGKKFAYNSIQRIITNEAYYGLFVGNKYEGKWKLRDIDEQIRVPNSHPALVDYDTWIKANQIVTAYKFKTPRKKNNAYPTSNILLCGNCGKNLTYNLKVSTGKVYIQPCRVCKENRGFYYNPIAEIIRDEIRSYRKTLQFHIYTMRNEGKRDNTKYEIEKLEGSLKQRKKALEILQEQLELGVIDMPTFVNRQQIRKKEVREIEKEINELKMSSPEDKLESMEFLYKNLGKLYENWEFLDGKGMDSKSVNKILSLLLDKVVFKYPKGEKIPTVEIYYR
jgi:site-specific DNA recombinase